MTLFIFIFTQNISAQNNVIDTAQYPFINFAANKFYVPQKFTLLPVFRSFEQLLKKGDNKVNIVQIGDSHIQADIFSDRFRKRVQEFFPGGNGGRGFIFPYTIAHTNNPYNYKVEYTGKWKSCRNVEWNKTCPLGLAGISVTTYDSIVTITISQPAYAGQRYDCTRVRIFYDETDTSHTFEMLNPAADNVFDIKDEPGIHQWDIKEATNVVSFSISRKSDCNTPFTLYGLTFETRDPGIVYHAIGVNGAEVLSYLRCDLMSKQLRALQPDLVILSLGTNDAFAPNFDSTFFHNNYVKLIDALRAENPDVPILLTTPGDCYFHKKVNAYEEIAARVMVRIGTEKNCAVWDFYKVMGGYGSIANWSGAGLTQRDKVHLSNDGYKVQGDLLYEAFIDAYDNYLNRKK
ncbi:MAG: GDSL-type esterase/lipase family protein [Bacteroidetes bacterium]|nr:GDSL-type esterase/lipase family protein [Bacteroidota bacterium]